MKKVLFILLSILILSAVENVAVCQDTLLVSYPKNYDPRYQDTVRFSYPRNYDPHYNKVIPDKVFEIGLPLLVLFLIASSIVSVFKVRAENRLKEKALDKQLSEATLIALFAQDRSMAKFDYLKWALVLGSLGISVLVIQLLSNTYKFYSGYWGVGIMFIFLSIAFLIYYNILRRK
jgi:hypothetical protein